MFHRADRRWKWICSCQPECLSVEVSSNISHHNHINSRQMDVGPEPIFPVGCRDAGRLPSNPPVLPWPPLREGCSDKTPQTQKDSLTRLECFTFSSDFDYFFTEVWHIDVAEIKPWCRSHSWGGGGALKEQMYEAIKQIKKLKDAEMLMEHYRSIKDKTNANRNRPRSAACVPFHWADAKKC